MTATGLTLRSDLILSRQTAGGATVLVVKDPVVDRFFRFGAAEDFILGQLDGTTPPEELHRRVRERFDGALPPAALDQFLERLGTLGLLRTGVAPAGRASHRVRGDLFYLRFRLFDPDRLFDRMLPWVRFLFTPAFIILSASLVVVAVGISCSNWNRIVHEFGGLLHFESLALAWFVMLAVIGAHEFSHGLTCKHFGGRVREIGFLLIYFQPAFYCNVSDAWLFPEKSRRLWVTFAGAWFEVFLWAVATLAWRVTDPASGLNHLALVVTVTSAFKAFFNLNPLIKLDGYYLLSDWLGIPNLRQKAFAHLRDRLGRLAGAATAGLAETTPGERRILLGYAVLAGVYTYWLLGRIGLWFGGFLVERYQGWGFILFTSALGLFFRQPIGQLLSPLKARLPHADGQAVPFRRVRLGVGLAALALVAGFTRLELKVAGPFAILPLHNADVRAEVEGIIEEIYVDEGDQVGAGAPIARLSERDYGVELRKTRAETEVKQAQLKLLKAGPRPEEIDLARTQVAKAGERLGYARGYLGRYRQLVEQKSISAQLFEEAQEQAAVREKELEEAREQLSLLLAGRRPEEIEALEADIRRLGAHERYLQEQVAALVLVSPIAGVVTTPRLREKIGENVKKGDLVAEVHELTSVNVEIAVPEKEIAEVQIGQKVTLKAQAYPRRSFEGQVVAIAPIATRPTEAWDTGRTVAVRTRLDNPAGLLKPEMTGHAKIHCGQQPLGELALRRAVRFIRVEFWSWW